MLLLQLFHLQLKLAKFLLQSDGYLEVPNLLDLEGAHTAMRTVPMSESEASWRLQYLLLVLHQ
jgi:hypothetical protein